MRWVSVAAVGAALMGFACRGATVGTSSASTGAEPERGVSVDPTRPWIDVEDELGEPPPPMAWPMPEAWVPARDFDPGRQGLSAAIDERGRFAVVSSELGDIAFFDVPSKRLLARSRAYLVREGDEDAFVLEPRIARNGDFLVFGSEYDARTVVRYDGSDLRRLFPALDGALDAKFPWDADADLRTFAFLEEGDPSVLRVFERSPDGTVTERCSVEHADLLFAELSMSPSGASILVSPEFGERQSSPPPRTFQAFLVRTRDCSVIELDGAPVYALPFRPGGGQMLVIQGDRVQARSPRDGRILGELPREGATGAAFSPEGSSFRVTRSSTDARFFRSADGAPASSFELAPYGEVPSSIQALPRGESLVLEAGAFTVGDGLVVRSRSDAGSARRTTIRLAAEDAADACGPMTSAAERIAAIRRSLDCIATPGLRALDRSADGRRALVYSTDPRSTADDQATATDDETSGDMHLYDVASDRLGPRLPRLYSDSYFGEPIGAYAELSPDGRTLLLERRSDDVLELVDARTGRTIATRPWGDADESGYADARTILLRTADATLVLGARRGLPELERRPLSASDHLLRSPEPDGYATDPEDGSFVFHAPDGRESRHRGTFLAVATGGRFLARCDDGTIFVDSLEGSRPRAEAGRCADLPQYARASLRDDGSVLALAEGDRLFLRRVGTSASIELLVLVADGHRTIAIRDDAGHVAILEGQAEDLRIRPAGDLLTVSVGPVTESPEARESLRRMMAPGD